MPWKPNSTKIPFSNLEMCGRLIKVANFTSAKIITLYLVMYSRTYIICLGINLQIYRTVWYFQIFSEWASTTCPIYVQVSLYSIHRNVRCIRKNCFVYHLADFADIVTFEIWHNVLHKTPTLSKFGRDLSLTADEKLNSGEFQISSEEI